ncbi:MAG: GntR family transcriptional regulator [Chitinivibrionales bacterium]|nr:GntR family transcriptional regulator [Chitinivibrionales bacterium]
MQPHHSKESIAYRYLGRVIDQLKAKSIDQLPRIRTLAKDAGVSVTSMQRALKRLQAEGVIVVQSRRWGARIANAASAKDEILVQAAPLSPAEKPSEYRWEKIRRRLAEDVLNGTYKESRKLPTVKELGLQYGDCYRTIAKALRALADSGMIREYGNHYAVTPLLAPSRTTIYLFVHEILLPAHLNYQDERRRDFLRLLEVACKDRSLTLKIAGINSFAAPSFAREYKGAALGAIVWCTYSESKFFLDKLIAANRPVAIIDESEYYRDFMAKGRRMGRNIRFMVVPSAPAAKNIGKMLLRLGHCRVAYISIYGAEQYLFSIQRLEGLRAAFAAAGLQGGVAEFISYEGAASGQLPAESLLRRPEVIDFYDWAQKLHSGNSDKNLVDRLIFTFQNMLAEEKYRQLCTPPFERALADPTITAWVCANDLIAFFAADFLKANGKPCPADISLVGFDDLFRSFQSDLTSYNFNIPLLVHRLIQYLLSPSADALFQKQGPIEIPGHIMQRSSVGKARSVA